MTPRNVYNGKDGVK